MLKPLKRDDNDEGLRVKDTALFKKNNEIIIIYIAYIYI